VVQSREDGRYFVGDDIELQAVAQNDTLFDGWYIGGNLVSKNEKYLFEMTVNAAITAKFIPNPDAPHTHSYTQEEIITPAKCEMPGERKLICPACGDFITEPIPEIGHKWDDGTITKEPTENEEGIRSFICLNDPSHTKTEPIPRLSHTHNWSTAWSKDANNHWKVCSGCTEKGSLAAHTPGNWIVDKAATHTATGSRRKECTVCGYTTVTETIPKTTAHTWSTTYTLKKAATCTATGSEVRKCTGCGVEDTPRTIAKKPHSYGTAWKNNATQHWKECSCGAKSGTAAHTYGAWTTTTKATVNTTGLQTRTCTVCKVKDTATKTLPKLTAPTITGPKTMTLKQDYAKTSSKVFTIKGNAAPTVTKKSGDKKITWNNKTKKLDIAAGLAPGKYPVTLTVKNSVKTITYTFTLTVEKATRKPAADKKAATYTDKVTVKLTSATKDATIYYTLDGKAPTAKSKSVKNGGTVTISKTATLKFMAVAPKSAKLKDSVVNSVKYTIKTKAPDTKAAPANKTVKKNSTITLTAPKGVTLYYTTDGKTNPTTKTTTKVTAGKTANIKIDKTKTVKVIAVKSGCTASAVVTRTYKVS
ncbi:MAG: chitobiase/beta-hexosaminidase C-terminal domain-containing protein, partial [Defluviitaleaceae bacterium]|nr:chitobiase/beta-hexosaminidase C-terminal domain-containing protein [Defluviitaleaceae bacterium]